MRFPSVLDLWAFDVVDIAVKLRHRLSSQDEVIGLLVQRLLPHALRTARIKSLRLSTPVWATRSSKAGLTVGVCCTIEPSEICPKIFLCYEWHDWVEETRILSNIKTERVMTFPSSLSL